MKRFLVSVGIFFVLLVVVALAMELTATPRQQAMRYYRTRNVFQYQPGNVLYDPALGYRVAPHLNVEFSNREFTTHVRTNTIGFRDDDSSLNDPDVYFLGDSYAFGWGVEEQDGVEKRYEQITGRRVLNMSAPGYSNIQEMLMLLKWNHAAPITGKPIFLFLASNDFIDNENTSFDAFPYFIETGGNISISKPMEQAFNTWQQTANQWMIHTPLARKSMLVYYMANAVKNMQVRDIYSGYLSANKPVKGNKAFLLMAEQLARFSQARQCPVTVVYIPPAGGSQAAQQLPFLQKVCGKLSLRLIDLSAALTAADYYPLDKHWRPSAHLKAARYLAR